MYVYVYSECVDGVCICVCTNVCQYKFLSVCFSGCMLYIKNNSFLEGYM